MDWGIGKLSIDQLELRRSALLEEIQHINAEIAALAAADRHLWVTIQKAAGLSSFSYETIRRWAKTGKIKSIEKGGRTLVAWPDVENRMKHSPK